MSTQLAVSNEQAAPIFTAIDRADLGAATCIKYRSVVTAYLATGASLGDADALTTFAGTLSASRKAHMKAAVRLWAGAVSDLAKSQATPENIDAVQATVYRAEAITKAITVRKAKGTKAHTWLSQTQVKALSNAVGNGIVGARDKAVLGLMVAAGLRREEAVTLRFEDVKLLPVGEKMRTVLDVAGKGAKQRQVPISDTLATDLDKWGAYVGHAGLIARSLGRRREPGESLSAVALFGLARKYGARIGKPELAPHDLRRTYAQLGYDAGVPITQLSKLLGHESVTTTQRYLNLDLDLATTASDFIPW
jgi:integrase